MLIYSILRAIDRINEMRKNEEQKKRRPLQERLGEKLPTTLADISHYAYFYKENAVVSKVLKCCRIIGRFGTMQILTLYYMLRAGEVTTREKLLLAGALGYFILPMDLIPDFVLPVVGFTDDLAVTTIVLKILSHRITPAIREKARLRAARIFED